MVLWQQNTLQYNILAVNKTRIILVSVNDGSTMERNIVLCIAYD